MTWSTNNDLTNPFSARSMTDRYLTDQALKTNRSEMGKLFKRRLSNESESESDDDMQATRAKVTARSNPDYKPLSIRYIKTVPNSGKSSFSLKELILYFCCIR
ncbi:hypothetical protein [Candidatus Rhabdochlamydia sp. T3358]|uniref:hypothetical protein n=1 Tax=Candidatus Rhabdochlamydia sp. T3358 TaxID=2099795 RepID=UPI0010BBD617|nr:hypothetical protein [Candidatus Rhabdochlamydia sp. T3358]VHO05226.1 hypothetical protein RHT_01688 [Candidatus Rhabdochlamydia sp. T3358]